MGAYGFAKTKCTTRCDNVCSQGGVPLNHKSQFPEQGGEAVFLPTAKIVEGSPRKPLYPQTVCDHNYQNFNRSWETTFETSLIAGCASQSQMIMS